MPSNAMNGAATGASDDDYVVLGKLTSPYGVKGWLKVYSYTSPMDGILAYPEWIVVTRGERVTRRLVQGRRQGKGLVASLEGIDSREQAERLAGAEILLSKQTLTALAKVMAFGATPAACISPSSASARSHCPPFSHALMAALYVIVSLATPSIPIFTKSASPLAHA